MTKKLNYDTDSNIYLCDNDCENITEDSSQGSYLGETGDN